MVWKNMVGKEDLQKNGSVHESFRMPIGMESHYFNVFYLILFFTQEAVSRLKHAIFYSHDNNFLVVSRLLGRKTLHTITNY